MDKITLEWAKRDAKKVQKDIAWNHERLAFWVKALADNIELGFDTSLEIERIAKYKKRIEHNVTRFTEKFFRENYT